MSTIERKEYQETKILRTVSPVRNFRSSSQNLTEFDHNLDYLLEDLQNSVSRPGSSLGNYRESSKLIESSKTNSLNRFQNVKAANPVTEYHSDDAYNYTSPDGTKRVTGYKKESYSYHTSSGDSTRMQNNINQLDTLLDDLQQVKSAQFSEKDSYNNIGIDPEFQRTSKRSVQRELHYGDTPRSNSRTRTEYTEGTYGQVRGRSPSPSSKTSTLTKQTQVTNVHSYPMEIVETTAPDINPEILAHLDPNLHPPGNTKVTTTIKTYTYEIPGSGNYPTNLETEKNVYSINQSQTTPSRSFVYQKMENKSENYQRNIPGGVTETVTTRTYQPGYSPDIPPTRNQTYVYNETTTTRQNQVNPQNYYKYDSTTLNGYPPESNKTTRTNYGGKPKPTDVEIIDRREPLNIQYKYKSESTTTNNYKTGYPRDETEPLLPKPFPVENQPDGPPKRLDDLLADIGNEPPNSPYNASFTAHEQEIQQKKKIETLKRQQEDVDDQKKEPLQKTKNVSGPPVYYPPGHEMFAKKEESGAWRAEGGYQKASGKYQYEAESKSKAKSSSGAAVVPVCLPLCCGLPCSIL